jgi:murein DD-endopeptidase MepM/ murein hydrolase activator NlpD
VSLTPDETVRLTVQPTGWHSSVVQTPAWTDTVFVAGEIRLSLWTSLVDNPALSHFPGGDQNRLVDHLDKIFQWQVDFSRQIQQGDYYRFVFEREVRPDGSMRTGRMLAAELVNQGRELVALWFDPDGDASGTYYDIEGQSVRRAFLKAPLEFRRISSRFTAGRLHPVLGTWRAHRGVDYAADRGTAVRATADGIVTKRGVEGSYGNLVEVRHGNGFRTRYAHLNGFAAGLTVGSAVRQEDVVGYVGMTGLATGPHLHYEMLNSAGQVDPLSIELPVGDPIPTDAWDLWESQKAPRLLLLDRLPNKEMWTASARAQGPQPEGPGGDTSGSEPPAGRWSPAGR